MRAAFPLSFAALTLSGCFLAPPKAYTWTCAGGQSFETRYDKHHDYTLVSINGSGHNLPAAMSASGARYSNGTVEFWEKGGEAMLNGLPGGDLRECRVKDPA